MKKPEVRKYLLDTFTESQGWLQFFEAIQECLPEIDFFSIDWEGVIDMEVHGPALVHGAALARKYCRHQPTSSVYHLYRLAAKYTNLSQSFVSGDHREITWSSCSETINVTSESGYYKLDDYHWVVPFTSNSFLGATVGRATVIGVNNHIISFDLPVASIDSIHLNISPSYITGNIDTHKFTAKFAKPEPAREAEMSNSQRAPINFVTV